MQLHQMCAVLETLTVARSCNALFMGTLSLLSCLLVSIQMVVPLCTNGAQPAPCDLQGTILGSNHSTERP